MFGTREIELSPTAAVALLELDDLKAALGISGSDHDDELNGLIDEVSASIETYCGSLFGKRDVTERHNLSEAGGTLVLRYTPSISLTSVTTDGVAQDKAAYRLNTLASTLKRIDHAPFGCGEHVIVYEAGYATIPAAVSRAALELAKYLRSAAGENDDISSESVSDVGQVTYASAARRTISANGVALPNRVALMLAPYRRQFFI